MRSRAADALGKIGGPKVIDAVLQLVQEKDDDIRRAAIEILNQTKDERAVDHLIQATRDNDWWVSERAIDALAEIGSKRALPRLLEMLQTGQCQGAAGRGARARQARRAEADRCHLPLLARPEREIRIEAIQALAKLADDRQAEQVRAGLQTQASSAGPDRRAPGHGRAGRNGQCASGSSRRRPGPDLGRARGACRARLRRAHRPTGRRPSPRARR